MRLTWRQRWCGLRRGHDRVLAFVPSAVAAGRPRMVLRCTSCQHETPGVAPASRPPIVTHPGDPRRHAVVSCRLVLRKWA